jgi:hypothetical protein
VFLCEYLAAKIGVHDEKFILSVESGINSGGWISVLS